MNNRNSIIVLVGALLVALIFGVLQLQTANQTQDRLTQAQSTAVAQATELDARATAAVSTLEAAQTEAAAAQASALAQAENAAATAQANALLLAENIAATAQAHALAEAENAAATAQANALAEAENVAATAQAGALIEAENAAATAQANALAEAENAAATAQANLLTQAAVAQATVVSKYLATDAAGFTAVASTASALQTEAYATGAAQAIYTVTAAAAEPTGAVTAVAIAPTTIPVPTATTVTEKIPPGWERFLGNGVAIQLPLTYIGTSFGSDIGEVANMLRALGSDFEFAAQYLELNPNAFSLILFDTASAINGSVDNLVIVQQALGFNFNIEFVMDLLVDQLPSVAVIVEQDIVELEKWGKVGRVVLDTDAGIGTVRQLQYYIIDAGILYVIGFTTTPERFESVLPIFEQSIRTFEILS